MRKEPLVRRADREQQQAVLDETRAYIQQPLSASLESWEKRMYCLLGQGETPALATVSQASLQQRLAREDETSLPFPLGSLKPTNPGRRLAA